ncbi:MAG: CocE/NonD family hydrolase, partial [Novosphingobium sp.]
DNLIGVRVYEADFFADHSFDLASALAGLAKHRFVAGPYTHRGVYTGFTGARELPGTSSPAGPLGWGPLIAAWFDIHLRGGKGEAFPPAQEWLAGDPVRYYVEGENRWSNCASWPPATMPSVWHLGSGGDARSASGNGFILSPGEAPANEGFDSFTVDPLAPFPTHGGGTGMPEEGPEGIQDQREVDFRDDLLVYTGEPLSSVVRIAGRQQLVLNFACTAPDADLCVKLVDVDPHGYAYNVTEGFQRMRYRKGGTEDWLQPGHVEPVTITFHDTAHVFKVGHRIRVMIAGANFPRHSRNLHTKTVPEFGTADEAVS